MQNLIARSHSAEVDNVDHNSIYKEVESVMLFVRHWAAWDRGREQVKVEEDCLLENVEVYEMGRKNSWW